jgi:hypothetical protein
VDNYASGIDDWLDSAVGEGEKVLGDAQLGFLSGGWIFRKLPGEDRSAGGLDFALDKGGDHGARQRAGVLKFFGEGFDGRQGLECLMMIAHELRSSERY